MCDLEMGCLERIGLENLPVLSHPHPRIQNGFPQPSAPGRLCRTAPLLKELLLHSKLNGNSCSCRSCVCESNICP